MTLDADHEVCFEPGDPARTGRVVLWSLDGAVEESSAGSVRFGTARTVHDPPNSGDGLDVLVPGPEGVEDRTVPAYRLSIEEAMPLLLRAYRAGTASPSAAWWGAATAFALDLAGRGLLAPRLSDGDVDEWRAGPLGAEDARRCAQLEAAMPPYARAVPAGPGRLSEAGPLLRSYLDACADVLPRCPTVEDATPYAGTSVIARPELREWAEELAGGLRVVLRVEAGGDDFAELALAVALYHPDDPSVVVDAGRVWSGDAGLGPRAQVDAVLAIRAAARVWNPLHRLLERAVPDRIHLGDDETAELVGPGGARLRVAGVEVRWPRTLVTDVRVQARLEASAAPVSMLGGDRLFDFQWQVAAGDAQLSAEDLDRLAEATRPVVRLRNQWVVVPEDVVARARERTAGRLTGVEAIGAALAGRLHAPRGAVDVDAGPDLARLRDRLAESGDGDEPLEQPHGLHATLRDYQLRGLRWLTRMTSEGMGCCLADDMGLGKTVTVIALHLRRQRGVATAGPTLVVCPATLMANWEREIDRFAPGTPVRRFHGARRSLDAPDGFVLTTYGTMRRDAERLAEVDWDLVVADEAQHVKNRSSSTATELRRIVSGVRVALTGTPVENNLDELWSILDWAVPGLLGTREEFRRRYADPVSSDRDPVVTERLRRLVAPFLLRRHKTDPGVAPELPRKTETDQPVSLTDEQVGLYEAAVREGMAEVGDASGLQRAGRVFAMLTALKQICNHPAQYLHEGEPTLHGRSGKLALLDELVDTIRSEGGATLVFTQYVAMARLLRRHLDDRGVGALLLDGSTPVARRQELVEAFQRGEAPVFLLSLKAAGVGLNLTRADHVVHYDRWWNPAVEDQATDRAYRIGQTRPVQVHRLVAEGTVEDRIATMLSGKRALAESVLASGESALSELPDDELEDLVSLRSIR